MFKNSVADVLIINQERNPSSSVDWC